MYISVFCVIKSEMVSQFYCIRAAVLMEERKYILTAINLKEQVNKTGSSLCVYVLCNTYWKFLVKNKCVTT